MAHMNRFHPFCSCGRLYPTKKLMLAHKQKCRGLSEQEARDFATGSDLEEIQALLTLLRGWR